MATYITATENHRNGTYQVDVNLAGRRERFESMMDAQKWLTLMKVTGGIEQLQIHLKDILIMLRKEMVYESTYSY